MGFITTLLIFIGVLILSAIPLHLAVIFFGGKSSILKVILVNFIAAIAIAYINLQLGILGGIVSFIALLLIYKFMFRLGIIRAFLVWVFQGVIAFFLILLVLAIFALFGIALII